jgi:hypothetical protein
VTQTEQEQETEMLATQDILTAGKATFTLAGMDRRWTFRIVKVENDDNREPIYFATLLTGSDNEDSYTYLGVYQPQVGWVKLTKASQYKEDSEVVRALRWVVGLIYNNNEAEVESKGFRMVWSSTCQRCGRTLTVPSSVDNRLGPECAKKVD